MIETHQLGKRFRDAERGEVRAVQDVTFRCAGGQIYGLLGANGAGKTTTLRMLATILAPSEGRATIAGFDAETQAEQVRRNIGFLSTATALYARLTAEEMVQYFGRLHGMSESVLR
jgi:sodium transport system ATP-binding protein